MSSSARYRIHPAIGIARVGNAEPSEYFLGPELPNQKVKRAPDVGTAVPPFKSDGLVKRQAARFRVWEYVENDGVWTASREVSLDDDDVVELAWTVHLANRKASFFKFEGLDGSRQSGRDNRIRRNDKDGNQTPDDRRRLEIDPLARSIGGRSAESVDLSKGASATPSQERWPDPPPNPEITSLGQLRTDGAGRLIVVAGAGMAGGRFGTKIGDYANNDDWFDDVGDGPVTVTLKLRGVDGTVTEHQVHGAWVLVGPPDFAPPLPQLVSLYDVLFDLAVRELAIPSDESVYHSGELARLSGLATLLRPGATPNYTVDFDTDVAPILRAAFAVTSVFAPAHDMRRMGGDGIDAKLWAELSDPSTNTPLRKRVIFNRVRPPVGFGATASAGFGDDLQMPKLLGDDPYNENPTEWRMFTVTPTQFMILQRWGADDFVGSKLGPSSLLDPPAPETVTPHGLDRAATECASGGAFFPGIEVGWLIREPDLFAEPFRIRHGAQSKYLGDKEEARTTVGAGYFSRQMALPWLADFLECKGEIHPKPKQAVPPEELPTRIDRWGWWPSQRPDLVVGPSGQRVPWHRAGGRDGIPTTWPDTGTDEEPGRDKFMPSYREMVANWWRFGFIEPVDGDGEPITHWDRFVEAERADQVPLPDDVP